MRKLHPAIFVWPVLVIAGCVPVEPLPTEEEILTSYFTQLVGAGIEGEEQIPSVQSGSVAETFASDLATRIDTAEADGLIEQSALKFSLNYSQPAVEGEEAVLEDASLCLDATDYPEADQGYFCFVFTNFQYEGGQLVGFDTTGDPIHGQVILQYFGHHAMPQPADMAQAVNFAVVPSWAEWYALQQSYDTQTYLDGGNFYSDTDELVFRGETLFSCNPSYKKPDVLFEDACAAYSEFSFEGDRLLNFKAGDSLLDERIVLYDGEALPIGEIGSIKILSAYVTIAGDLVITAEVTSSTEELTISRSDSFYIGNNNRQIESSGMSGPVTLKNGRVGNVSYSFSGGTIGGDLEANFYDENYNDVSMAIQLHSFF
jgi:hypothetical protein